jgi:hexosaminidase
MFACLTAGCQNNAGRPHFAGQTPISIIPKPSKVTINKGCFRLGRKTKIYIPEEAGLENLAGYLAQIIRQSSGYDLEIKKFKEAGNYSDSITLRLENQQRSGEAEYTLSVTPNLIAVKAAHPAGLFYGVQTLRQLLPADTDTRPGRDVPLTIPCVEIEDKPAFVWRGLLLDCSRRFLSKEYIIRYIDLLALYKMNVLQLHLTDDQGWRLEIKKYPELTETCSKFSPRYTNEKGGYYSQEQMREIIAYAKSRFVTIVPEIEMPGHSSSVFAAYPQLSCTGQKTEIYPFWQGPTTTKDVFCAGNDEVFTFLENVLTEVIELFPSEYIHIGGDEVPKDRWNECPKCQARIRQEGLKDTNELQSYFIQRIERFINSRGRKLIGWDEILEGGLAKNAAVMSWRGTQGGLEAASMGHNVVMSPTSHCYFDYDVRRTPLKATYSFNPVGGGLSNEEKKFILGGQGNMWTQSARTESAIDRHIFPRLVALSEALWTPAEIKDFNDFHARLAVHYARLDVMAVKYGPEK